MMTDEQFLFFRSEGQITPPQTVSLETQSGSKQIPILSSQRGPGHWLKSTSQWNLILFQIQGRVQSAEYKTGIFMNRLSQE